ncbi:MAG TPA: hypothetical protein VF230_11720 [Acidimicrobiales bacterium]
MGEIRRFTSLFVAAAALLLAVPAQPANADPTAGVAVVDLAFVYDTPLSWGEHCTTEPTSTVTGSLTGAIVAGGQAIAGDFDIAGTAGWWFPGFCDSFLFYFDITGTTVDGRALDCDARAAILPIPFGAAGPMDGTCTLDGAGSYGLDGQIEAQAQRTPALAHEQGQPTTGWTFTGTFLQDEAVTSA